MARAIWSGTLTFGLVTIPVKLYSAVQRKTVRFNQLDSDGLDRIQQKRVNARTGDEVPFERIVKGYEVTPERYIVIEPGELDALDPKRSREIELEDFVDASEIAPIFYDATYHLAPAEGGAKPYRLLVEAMTQSGKVGIARFVLRSKEYVVALRPAGDALELSTMLFADEIADPRRLEELDGLSEIEVGPRELAIANQLIDALSASFEPGKYRDEYRERVLALIDAKAEGQQIEVAPAVDEPASPTPDLMAALKASLAARERPAKPKQRTATPAAKAKARKPAPKRAAKPS